ncbi:hypothetical protein B0G57_115119 [Trinickia symbiotica]|uniref:Secreted protein n=1 Tax=Trinickia symbiotica TaxID=863227 RepID=A0A2N7X5Z8_9BURK|nr:hypothetical protein [Trinickia symbiotica]PMS37047.1 hypothetical protein C0Z20_10050 [Trinickia symbiotica]PPK43015.1 hypothetical protein B0G57_115119 [Trinickia symbiotica]
MTKLLPVCCILVVHAAYCFAGDSSPYSGARGDAFAYGGTGFAELDRSTNPGLVDPRTGSAIHNDMWQLGPAAAAGATSRADQDLLAPSIPDDNRHLVPSLANLSVEPAPPMSSYPFLAARKVKKRVSLRGCRSYPINVCPAKLR